MKKEDKKHARQEVVKFLEVGGEGGPARRSMRRWPYGGGLTFVPVNGESEERESGDATDGESSGGGKLGVKFRQDSGAREVWRQWGNEEGHGSARCGGDVEAAGGVASVGWQGRVEVVCQLGGRRVWCGGGGSGRRVVLSPESLVVVEVMVGEVGSGVVVMVEGSLKVSPARPVLASPSLPSALTHCLSSVARPHAHPHAARTHARTHAGSLASSPRSTHSLATTHACRPPGLSQSSATGSWLALVWSSALSGWRWRQNPCGAPQMPWGGRRNNGLARGRGSRPQQAGS
ncbi:hypothetical protein DFH27DRAFT_608158 [Peziza echinospora]|nr:hypothetical protein DFH27DRAFT_608158 [Peziza echinospora]